jgi:hypothetical protein
MMYVTKNPPQKFFAHIYKTFDIKPTLSPFAEEILSNIGLKFDSFFVEKAGRIKTRFYNYKIIDEEKLKNYDPQYKSSCYCVKNY